MAQDAIEPAGIWQARRRIAGAVRRTPLVPSPSLSRLAGQDVMLKLECLQATGAFKLRGAVNFLRSMTHEALARGVVTSSTGNHGRAVALAARDLGCPAVVCLSSLVPPHKRAAIEALGAEVRIAGRDQDEAEEAALALAESEGLTWVPPFDHPAIIAGQGTIGIELMEDAPELETVIVPLSGGGLLGGIALAVKTINPAIRIVGVSMERGPAMILSIREGRPVPVEEEASLADSLGGGIGADNRWTLELARRYVSEAVLVSEDEIADAMRHLFLEERLVTEGGAAVGVAALLAGRVKPAGPTAVIVSGQNVDMTRFLAIMNRA